MAQAPDSLGFRFAVVLALAVTGVLVVGAAQAGDYEVSTSMRGQRE